MKSCARRLKTCQLTALVLGLSTLAPSLAEAGAPKPVASSVATPAPPSQDALPVEKKRASEARKMLVLEFGAEWCAPCKQFERDVLPKASVRVALSQVHFVRYDAETAVGKEAARALSVEGYPTFVALRTDGEVASVLQGSLTEAEFVRWVDQVAKDFEPRTRLEERLQQNPSDGEAMLLLALRLRKSGNLSAAVEVAGKGPWRQDGVAGKPGAGRLGTATAAAAAADSASAANRAPTAVSDRAAGR